MPSSTFSTDAVHPPERLDYLDAYLRASFFDMALTVAATDRPTFDTRARIHATPRAAMIDIETTALAFERGRQHIENNPSGAFIICRSDQGRTAFDVPHRDPVAVDQGGFTAGSADLPFSTLVKPGESYRFRVIALAETRLDAIAGARRHLPLQQLIPGQGITSLLTTYCDTLWREIGHLNPVEEEVAIDTLAHLVALVRGTLATASPDGTAALREARLQRAREHISRNLADPALSPASAARALGISARQLHLLFEPSGQSFARHLLAKRLSRAKQLLLAEPLRPVIDVAFGCGFESLSTFNRSFRQAFGGSPTDLRNARRTLLN